MMEKLQQEIFDLIDGLLPTPKRKEIETFLKSNPDAADFYNEIRSLRNRLSSLQSIKTSPDFDADLRARIRMEKRLGRAALLPEYVRVPSLAFAGAAVVMVLFLAFGPNSRNVGSVNQPDNTLEIQSIQDNQQTFYTLDTIDLDNNRGTQLSSESHQRAASQRDSIRSRDNFERHIRVVEF